MAVVPSSANQQQPRQLDAVVNAWEARQRAVRSFDFIWEGSEFISKRLAERDVVLDGNGTIPDDHVFEVTMQCLLDDQGRVRVEYEGESWAPKMDKYVPKKTTSIYDRRQGKTFFANGHGHPGFFVSDVDETTLTRFARDPNLRPLWLAYRALDVEYGQFHRQRLQLIGELEAAPGQRHLILEDAFARDWRARTWVDPTRGFIPIRFSVMYDGAMTRDITIEYLHDEQHGWVPASWKSTMLDLNGEMLKSISARVTDYRINTPISNSAFTVELPAGTWVRNYITNERYILRDDGKKRHVLPGEFDGTNYEQLLRSDSPTRGGVSVLVMIISTVFVLLLVALIWRIAARSL